MGDRSPRPQMGGIVGSCGCLSLNPWRPRTSSPPARSTRSRSDNIYTLALQEARLFSYTHIRVTALFFAGKTRFLFSAIAIPRNRGLYVHYQFMVIDFFHPRSALEEIPETWLECLPAHHYTPLQPPLRAVSSHGGSKSLAGRDSDGSRSAVSGAGPGHPQDEVFTAESPAGLPRLQYLGATPYPVYTWSRTGSPGFTH